jgi:hypothetical protein
VSRRERLAEFVELIFYSVALVAVTAGRPILVKVDVQKLVKLAARDFPKDFVARKLFPEGVNQKR